MNFIIENGRLVKVEKIEKTVHVPYGVTSIAPGAFWDRTRKTEHIYLPETITTFEEDKYSSAFDVHKGTVITLPASVYQRITYEVATNEKSASPYKNSEIRFDIVKEDGVHIELFFINDSDFNYRRESFWQIDNFENLSAEDFCQYDSSIEEAFSCNQLKKRQKIKMALCRLFNPYMLSEKHRASFKSFIESHIEEARECISEWGDIRKELTS